MKVPITQEETIRWRWALWSTLTIALLLRLWGVDYGLPFSYWQDEYHEIMRAMQLGTGSFNFARTTKGGFYLLLFVEYGIYFVILKMTGMIASSADFARDFVRDPTVFYLIGRSTAAIMGTLTVAAVFWMTRQAYSTASALVAALLLAVNMLHVDVSHRIGVDVPMVMFASVTLYFGLRIALGGGRRDYILAGVFAALATTTKLPGILVLLPLLIAHTFAISDQRTGIRGWIVSRDLWIAAAAFLCVLLVTAPGYFAYTEFGHFLPGSAGDSVGSDELEDVDDLAFAVRPNLYYFYLSVIQQSMGWPLFVASIAAVIFAAWKRNRFDIMLVAYVIANYLAITGTSSENLYYPRYALPIIVVMAVLAGRMLMDIVSLLPQWRSGIAVTAIAGLTAIPIANAYQADIALTMTDTRTVAKEWFERQVPAGARVLLEGSKTGPKRETVQLAESRASVKRHIDYWRNVEPRQAKFLEFKLAATGAGGYDLELVRVQSMKPLDTYVAAGVSYFVIRPVTFMNSRKTTPHAVKLLEDLRSDPRVRLMKRFAPEAPSYPGDIIEFYHLERGEPAASH